MPRLCLLPAVIAAGLCGIGLLPVKQAGAVPPCGNVASPYGINAHAPQGASLDVLLDEVQAAGIDWIRIDFNWIWIETSKGSFNWTIYDQITAAAAARGIQIFATIAYTPAWATSGQPQTGVPDNPADWYDFCFRAAQRYHGAIRHWGMWNEPNLTSFWTGTRQQYINVILRNGSNAVRAANPDALVLGPELAHLSSSTWWAWLEDCLTQAGDSLDIVTHHVYCSSGHAACTERLEKPRLFPWENPSLKDVLQQTGWLGKPVWLTEVGWQSGSSGQTQQASNYTNLLTSWFSGQPDRDWLHKVFFYELHDTQAFPQLSWGILGQDPAFPRKPAFHAYRDFITAYPAPPVPPGKAIEPSPAPQAVDVGFEAVLSWTPGCGASSHDVYFGTSSPGAFRASQSSTSFNPGPLMAVTTYFWRIDEVNAAGTTIGDVWSFTTAPAPGDFDRDGDVDQEDFGFFQLCYTQPPVLPVGPCVKADLDSDGIVDQDDFAILHRCMSGANVPAAPACAD